MEAVRVTHGGNEHGPADVGDTGQRAGQPVGIDSAVGDLSGTGVGVALGQHRAHQPGFGRHLGCEIRERHRRVVAVELDRRGGDGPPGVGAVLAVMTTRCLADQADQPGTAGAQQRPRVAVTLQDRDVRVGELPADRVIQHRHRLAGQLAQPHLVARRRLGETIGSPHATVKARRVALHELQALQAVGVHDRQTSEGLGVDRVRLRMLRQELPQRCRLRRAHPMHDMAAAAEEHRHRQPRRARWFDDHLQARPRRRAGECCRLNRLQTLDRRPAPPPGQHRRGLVDHDHRVAARDPEIDADDAPCRHRRCLPSPRLSIPTIQVLDGHGPTVTCSSTGRRPQRAGPRPYPGPPWPGRRRHSDFRSTTHRRPQCGSSRLPPNQPGSSHATPWTEPTGGPEPLTCVGIWHGLEGGWQAERGGHRNDFEWCTTGVSERSDCVQHEDVRCAGRGPIQISFLAAVVAVAACSSRGDDTRAVRAAAKTSTTTAAPTPTKGPILESPSLEITIDPAAGAPGTKVHIVVTGCNDPTGLNHAISFNNDAENMSARNDPNTVRSIVAEQDGTTLTATYTIQYADVTGGAGLFFAQCAATMKTAPFTVVRP